jgi:hypothetical protein
MATSCGGCLQICGEIFKLLMTLHGHQVPVQDLFDFTIKVALI